MKSICQLLRQPFKTIAGIFMSAIAVVILCVSYSQTLAAEQTSFRLAETYITVALPTNHLKARNYAWLNSFTSESLDLIKSSVQHGFASAYIANLNPDNHTQHIDPDGGYYTTGSDLTNYFLQPTSLSYDGAMLEIITTDCSMPSVGTDLPPGVSIGYPAYAQIKGKVVRVVGLQSGYSDPTDFSIVVSFMVESEEEYNDLVANLGERYLVYGQNYTDLDWNLRNNLLSSVMVWWDDTSLPEWDMSTFVQGEFGNGTKYKCKIGDLLHGLSDSEMSRFRTVSISIPSSDTDSTYPRIELLGDSTVEDFLRNDSSGIWRSTLENIQISSNSFPVIATDYFQGIAAFSLGRADISAGRAFTNDEISRGTRVCIISQSLADAHALQIGDTIDLQYFVYDMDDPNVEYIHDGIGIVNPRAYNYNSATMSLCENTQYEIIGLYRQDSPWGSVENDLYSFTPNTIFVPKASVTGTIDYVQAGQFFSLVLYSDKLYETQQVVDNAGLADIFEYYDNGYSTLASSLKEYTAAAKAILPIGIVVYAVIVLLFLFLFPAQQYSALSRMDSLGAGHIRRVTHIFKHTLGIFVPGSILGTYAATKVWGILSDALRTWMSTDIAIQLDTQVLWSVCGIQTIVVAILSIGLGVFLSVHIRPMNKR